MKKNILITGISKGIGKYLLDDLKNDNEIIGISRTKSDENSFKQFNIDLTSYSLFNKVIKYLKQEKKVLDILILNAGVGEFGKFEDNSFENYKNVINTNLLGNINILKLLENYINKDTKIIFIGSIIGKKFMKNAAVYQASKFGLRGFAGGLRDEGKKVFILNPKIVNTGFHDGKIKLDKRFTETKLEDILEVVNNIIIGNEKRFEIDL